MYLNNLLKELNISRYRLAKDSGVPKTTIIDICSGKASIEKCSADTIYKIAKTLGVSMESIVRDAIECPKIERISFDIFRSNICHLVKDKGDIDFIIDTLSSDEVRVLFNRGWYPEAFYLLATVDYLSRINDVPICTNYNDIRAQKLEKLLFNTGVVLTDVASESDDNSVESLNSAIPEFLNFNIVEDDIRDVC
ncbi:MAG: helix-turn-helix transcriptional regulator [Ruminococcaceae bacterium]|nr:helix-turn-helix transcriptional regulator [Oscillospiraceae bacterium]